MGTEKINRLKIVLVEQGKTGKWLDSINIGSKRERFDKQRH